MPRYDNVIKQMAGKGPIPEDLQIQQYPEGLEL